MTQQEFTDAVANGRKDFSGEDLSYLCLAFMDLSGFNFECCILHGTCFTCCILHDTCFRYAEIERTIFSNARLRDCNSDILFAIELLGKGGKYYSIFFDGSECNE